MSRDDEQEPMSLEELIRWAWQEFDRDSVEDAVSRIVDAVPWRKLAVVALIVSFAVALRVGWSYTVANNQEYQCAALHLFVEDRDGHLHTTDVAASTRFNEVESIRVLRQLAADGFLETAGQSGIYPHFRLTASAGKVEDYCSGVAFRRSLREQEYWRIDRG